MRLSIVIPAHNEEARIGRMLDAYLPYFEERHGAGVEFLVVVNGTTDGTESVVRGYAADHPGLRCIVEPGRIGKGGALMLGFRAAQGDLVGFVDADGSTPPPAFDDLVHGIGESGAIIASRWCRGADVSPRQPLARRIASRIFNLLVRTVFGLRLTDTQCGAKLMRREALQAVLPGLGITRWAFDVDLLFQLKRAGYAVTEIATTWHDVAGSKVQVVRTSLEMLVALVRLRLLYSPLRWVVGLYDRYIGPIMHPAEVEPDNLLRHGLLLMVGAQATNICNLLFQVVMMRMLGRAEFGVLAALWGACLTVAMPLMALTQTVSHFTARLLRTADRARVRAMLGSLAIRLVVVGLVLVGGILLARDGVGAFFKVEQQAPVVIAAVLLGFMLWRPVLDGALNGAQAFAWTVAVAMCWGVARLLLGVLFAAFGLGAAGGLLATALGLLLSIVLGTVGLHRTFGGGSIRPRHVPGFYAYLLKYVTALAGYSVLMNADVVLVKRFFDPETAGLYARASIAAKSVIFLPQPIAAAMFPKVVSGGAVSYGSWRTLLKALTLAGVIVFGFAVLCTVVAGPLLLVFSGERVPELVPVLRTLVWSLFPLTLVFLLMNFELAQRRFAVTIPLVLCALGYLGGVAVWHGSLLMVVGVLGVANLAALGATVMLVMSRSKTMVRANGREEKDP